MRQAFAPVGTRLRRAAATEDGGESVFEWPGRGNGVGRACLSSALWLGLPLPRLSATPPL